MACRSLQEEVHIKQSHTALLDTVAAAAAAAAVVLYCCLAGRSRTLLYSMHMHEDCIQHTRVTSDTPLLL
jgi:hypothetical protein